MFTSWAAFECFVFWRWKNCFVFWRCKNFTFHPLWFSVIPKQLVRIPNNSMLLRQLYCSDLAWFFSSLMILSSSFAFKFFTTVTSLFIFSSFECSWDIASFSFDIWLQRFDISESTITFSFKVIIFSTSLGFFMTFIADSDKVNKLVLSPVLIWLKDRERLRS